MSFGKAGTSEEYLGRAIQKNIPRDRVVIASKVYFNERRLSKTAIEREIDGSLKRLGMDYLDLYIIHRFDDETPMEETMEALDVKLSEEDLEKLEACYVPHPIVGAIDKNPEQGGMFPVANLLRMDEIRESIKTRS